MATASLHAGGTAPKQICPAAREIVFGGTNQNAGIAIAAHIPGQRHSTAKGFTKVFTD